MLVCFKSTISLKACSHFYAGTVLDIGFSLARYLENFQHLVLGLAKQLFSVNY